MKVRITIKNLQKKKLPVSQNLIRRTIHKALRVCAVNQPGEINVYFVDNRKIKNLNRRYLKKNYSTDVIAFDLSKNKKEIFADIFISFDMAISQAKVFKTSVIYELYLYLIHGILHLFGYDDRNVAGRNRMQRKEREILTKFF